MKIVLTRFAASCGLAFVGLLVTPFAHAGGPAPCASVANNLVTPHNCDFASGTGSWTLVDAGSLSHAAGDGSPAAGSAEVASTAFVGGVQSPCIAVPAASQSAMTTVAVSVKPIGFTPDTGCGMSISQYDGADCTGTESTAGAVGGGGVADTWSDFSGSVTLNADVVSLTVQAGCNDTSESFTVRVDNVVLAPATVPVELQAFDVE